MRRKREGHRDRRKMLKAERVGGGELAKCWHPSSPKGMSHISNVFLQKRAHKLFEVPTHGQVASLMTQA